MKEPPQKIPAGTKVASLPLADGNIAVKVNISRLEDGSQLYAVYSKDYEYQNELLDIHECLFRRDNIPRK